MSAGSQPMRRKAPLAFIFITVFVDMMGYGIVVPLLPFFVAEYGLGATAVGLVGTVYALMQFIAAPLLGSLSDRYGRRPVLLICLLGTACAYVILGLAATAWVLFLAVALDGATGGSMATAQAYIADSTSPEERTKGMALFGAAFGLGIVAGPALGGLLSADGLRTPAFIAAAIAFANVLFGLWVLPESLPAAQRSAATDTAFTSVRQLTRVAHCRTLRALLLGIFLLNLAFAGLYSNFPLFTNARFGWNPIDNGLFYTFVGVCAVVIQGLLVGVVQSRVDDRHLVRVGLGLMAMTLALLALATQPWMLYPVVSLLAFGTGISIPAATSLVSQQVGDASQGSLMGGIHALLSTTMMLGPLLAGTVFDLVGPSAPYAVGSLLACIALVTVWQTTSRIQRGNVLHHTTV